MGAAALCYAAEHSRRFEAIVLESVYYDIHKAFVTRIGAYPPYIRNLDKAILWVTQRRLGLRLAQLSPVEYVGALAPAPVLLLTGALDPHATPLDTFRLYDRCQGTRDVLIVPDADHGDVFETGGPFYASYVLDFLERYTAPARSWAA